MREILFRGKDIKGIWHIGLLAHIGNAWYISNKAGVTKAFEVIPETVGQYTGLTDKNGTKIFEGDVVTAPYIDPIFHSAWNEGNLTENTVVKYVDGMFYIEYVESKQKITLFGLLNGAEEAAVIGNIHDNPELMKGAE